MNENKIDISVVIPVYKNEPFIDELVSRLVAALGTIANDFEIIFVNDASPENDWEIIKKIATKDNRVKGINLSRNFGQHYAITAGLDNVCGQWVVVMDGDLQDQPEEIKKLYDKAKQGYDIVLGKRVHRQDNFLKKLSSKVFYIVLNYFTDMKTDATVANYGIYNRRVIQASRRIREQNRSFPMFIRWLGFRVSEVEVEHAKRPDRKSSYNYRKLRKLALDIIISHSNKPLKLVIKLGLFIAFCALCWTAWLVVRYLIWRVPVAGWTSVMVSIYLLGGLLFANIGVLGIYIGKIFDEAKKRPLYVIQETIGIEPETNIFD
jgi:glycosyltransferase involved in cell wall biosynthesis